MMLCRDVGVRLPLYPPKNYSPTPIAGDPRRR